MSLLLPGVAGKKNLAPLYDCLNTAIRSVDENTLIFYEPVTWSVYLNSEHGGTGFSSVPGGKESVSTAWLLLRFRAHSIGNYWVAN